MTAHVAHGLKIASNTVNVPEGMLSGAVRWLKNYQERQTALLEQGDKFRKLEQLPDGPEKKEALRKLGNYRLTASATDTLVYSVLAECGVKNLPMERYLFRDRLELPVISQIQLAEILLDAHRMDDFNKVMPVISQFLQQDDSLQTAWLRLPNAGYWWRWYGSSAATQAAYLKLMSKSAPGNPVTARLANGCSTTAPTVPTGTPPRIRRIAWKPCLPTSSRPGKAWRTWRRKSFMTAFRLKRFPARRKPCSPLTMLSA